MRHDWKVETILLPQAKESGSTCVFACGSVASPLGGVDRRPEIEAGDGLAGDACDSDSKAEDDQPGGEGPSHARRTLPARPA